MKYELKLQLIEVHSEKITAVLQAPTLKTFDSKEDAEKCIRALKALAEMGTWMEKPNEEGIEKDSSC